MPSIEWNEPAGVAARSGPGLAGEAEQRDHAVDVDHQQGLLAGRTSGLDSRVGYAHRDLSAPLRPRARRCGLRGAL